MVVHMSITHACTGVDGLTQINSSASVTSGVVGNERIQRLLQETLRLESVAVILHAVSAHRIVVHRCLAHPNAEVAPLITPAAVSNAPRVPRHDAHTSALD